MDQRKPNPRGRPRLTAPHVKICGYVALDFAKELAVEAAYRGITIGDLITEAFSNRTRKTWKDGA